VLQFGHVDGVLAKSSVDRVKSLGLQAYARRLRT
jgi:hypothetical protein